MYLPQQYRSSPSSKCLRKHLDDGHEQLYENEIPRPQMDGVLEPILGSFVGTRQESSHDFPLLADEPPPSRSPYQASCKRKAATSRKMSVNESGDCLVRVFTSESNRILRPRKRLEASREAAVPAAVSFPAVFQNSRQNPLNIPPSPPIAERRWSSTTVKQKSTAPTRTSPRKPQRHPSGEQLIPYDGRNNCDDPKTTSINSSRVRQKASYAANDHRNARAA